MKIIALLPVKNEAVMLPSYLSSVTRIADEIIALDDHSSDNSIELLTAAGAKVVASPFPKDEPLNMGKRRLWLLQEGRKNGGTHFIYLDADETFSGNFIENAKKIIRQLKPGQKLSLRWVHLWKDSVHYLNDTASPFGKAWKDFIVCDDGKMGFEERFLSEARTPGHNNDVRKIPEDSGVVLHWQFARWKQTQYKQALYRCIELLEGSRSARRINHTYGVTLDRTELKRMPLPAQWLTEVQVPDMTTSEINHYKERLIQLFKEHGIEKFEPLEIWHIDGLRREFVKITGHEPKIQTFPRWIVGLNRVRNAIKNTF